jgi:hypothetical protein
MHHWSTGLARHALSDCHRRGQSTVFLYHVEPPAGWGALMNHLRQMANNLLRQVDVKLSVKARRLQAAIDDDFRERVIFQGA